VLFHATLLEKPPTKKNNGITWSTQVASHRPGIASSAFSPARAPSSR
jgi:hypothetical protein